MDAKTAYLAIYNLASACGWAHVFQIAGLSVLEKRTPSEAWKRVRKPLCTVQTLAVAEIFHSVFGLVKSPVLSTVLQVASRLMVLWGFTFGSVTAQSHWSLYLMVLSWSFVEIPRYLFYSTNLLLDKSKMPYLLLWLRYSLFAMLYPSGISGELLQIVNASGIVASANDGAPRRKNFAFWATLLILASYLPGSPFMYLHMVKQRASALQV